MKRWEENVVSLLEKCEDLFHLRHFIPEELVESKSHPTSYIRWEHEKVRRVRYLAVGTMWGSAGGWDLSSNQARRMKIMQWMTDEDGYHISSGSIKNTVFILKLISNHKQYLICPRKGRGLKKARFVFYWLKHIALLLVEDSLLCFTFLTNRRFLPPLIFRHLSPFLSRPHLVWTFTHKYVRFWYIMIYSNGNSIFIIFATHLIFPFKCLQIQSLSLITPSRQKHSIRDTKPFWHFNNAHYSPIHSTCDIPCKQGGG